MISAKEAIECLNSLKQQIGESKDRETIDQIIELLKPISEPHGDLIDRDSILDDISGVRVTRESSYIDDCIKKSKVIVERNIPPKINFELEYYRSIRRY